MQRLLGLLHLENKSQNVFLAAFLDKEEEAWELVVCAGEVRRLQRNNGKEVVVYNDVRTEDRLSLQFYRDEAEPGYRERLTLRIIECSGYINGDIRRNEARDWYDSWELKANGLFKVSTDLRAGAPDMLQFFKAHFEGNDSIELAFGTDKLHYRPVANFIGCKKNTIVYQH